MTTPIAPDSPRRAHARRFADELRRAMAARGASNKRLAEAAHVTTSAIAMWKTAASLPTPATAARVAEVLDAPRLVTIAREARTKPCRRCGRPFVALMGSLNQDFCTKECRLVDVALRRRPHGAALYEAVRTAVDARLGGAPEGRTLPAILDALHEYTGSSSREVTRRDAVLAGLDARQAAIAAMCAACEPEGWCREAACPLRDDSPLPLLEGPAPSALRAPSSPHAPENRGRWLAAVRSADARRWSRPGERERQSELTRARNAGMTPEERAERGRRISAGRRAGIARRKEALA